MKDKTINERILIPGVGGELDDDEIVFIRNKMKENKALRRQWGLSGGHLKDEDIRRVALEGNGIEYDGNGRALNPLIREKDKELT